MAVNVEAQKEALYIFAKEHIDFKAICVELGCEHPEIFVELFRKVNSSDESVAQRDMQSEVEMVKFAKVKYIEFDRHLIQTIKALRHQFNLGLAEAKTIADRARLELQAGA